MVLSNGSRGTNCWVTCVDGEEGGDVAAVILFVYGLTGAFVDVAAQLRGGVVHRAGRADAREAA